MKMIIKFLVSIFIILFLIITYARYLGTMGLVTKEYTINDDNISKDYDGIKIVHFSDLHYHRAINISKVKSIVDEINLINPDIVVFTGDLIDKDVTLGSEEYDKLTNALKDINAKYGKYAILGNHDYEKDKDEIIKIFEGSNFKYLDNSYDIINSKNMEKIFIGGVGSLLADDNDIGKTMEYLKDKDEKMYKIILIHEPDMVKKITKDYNVDLILAGHSHNGQIRIPFVGPIYKPEGAKKYYDNYYVVDGTKLYISSGVGVSKVNFRLFDKPSINFYRINRIETIN